MKNLFLILFFTNYIFAIDIYEVKCPKDINYTSGNGNLGVDYWVYDGEDFIYGDWIEVLFEAWDSRSAVCGGALDKNIRLEFACDWNNDYCYESNNGYGDLYFTTYNEDISAFENNIIIANHIPCVDYQNLTYPTRIGHTLYNGDTNELYHQYVNFPIDYLFDSTEYILTENEAKNLRAMCNKTDIKPYVDELETQRKTIRDNTNIPINTDIFSLNTDILNLNSYIEDLNSFNFLNDDYSSITAPEPYDMSGDLTNFTNTYQTTLDDTFSSYGNVFGLGGYGSAPSPISFDLLGNTYTVFSESMFTGVIDYFRNTFLIFAYVWGFLIILKDMKDV